MKKLIFLFALVYNIPFYLVSQNATASLENARSFFPGSEKLKQEDIHWAYLVAPENWDHPSAAQIKMAVAVLKNKSKNSHAPAVVYFTGGPGAGSIKEIGSWLKRPLLDSCDVVLVDVRGTGYSQPVFCPELGKKFLEIMSKNQTPEQDENDKSVEAEKCKEDLMRRGIDISAYNSLSIAKDIHALKNELKYDNWSVYGVSYGTYMAQVYAAAFPEDIRSIILDSPISDISSYYERNSVNYVNSLETLFSACANDPDCSRQFPNLKQTYYETIDKLNKEPFTISVDKKFLPSGTFTCNAEDFKTAIQQSLYQKKLIEVMPLLITEFNKGNKVVLSSLITAFAGALGLDYGAYYAISCNEALPHNSIQRFDSIAARYPDLHGGLSFYRSDFTVYKKWQNGLPVSPVTDLTALQKQHVPVLIFSGAFDPITPPSNGEALSQRFANSTLVKAPVFGHGPGFSLTGAKIAAQFLNDPTRPIDTHAFKANHVSFASDISLSNGVYGFASSLGDFNLLFFAPLLLALVILLVAIVHFIFSFIRRKKKLPSDRIIYGLMAITALLGIISVTGFILAINHVAETNFYILAFGLPHQYDYLFILNGGFILLTVTSILFFLVKLRSISNKIVLTAILFSFVLICTYFQYWGFPAFV